MKKKPNRQPPKTPISLGWLLRGINPDQIEVHCERNGAGQMWAHFSIRIPGMEGRVERIGSINLDHTKAH